MPRAVAASPWWEVLELRKEIVDASGRVVDDVQASLYRVVYGAGATRPPYADAAHYGKITHPTAQLVDLLAKIAIRLGGAERYQVGSALTRLDQGMGGGKSHACIGAWHLSTDPGLLATQELGRAVFDQARQAIGRDLPPDLNRPHAVVLSCDNMTPGSPVPDQDGQWAYNLYERFLWRLFSGMADQRERYEAFRPHFANKAKISEAIASVGRPVLIIFDEILNYVGDGLEGTANPQLIAQDMAFLRALTEAAKDVPYTAMIVVMINSEKDSTTLRGDGESRRDDLQAYLRRNGVTASVNENADFAAILRRRLFTGEAPVELVADTAQAFMRVFEHGNWRAKVFSALQAPWTRGFRDAVARTYPFHPQLMHLAELEWANLAGYQQVRSTIMIFAATAYALASRGQRGEWAPLLIGPGDVPLSDKTVREAVINSGLITDTKTQGNYRSIAQSDIVDLTDSAGAARRLDLDRTGAPWAEANPRAAERAATMMFLASIVGARGGSRRGASDPEVKAATAVPDTTYDHAEADAVVRAVTDVDGHGLATVEIFDGRGGQPRRYYLSTRQRLPMLARSMRNSVTDDERDQLIAHRAADLLKRGPFEKTMFVGANPERSHRETLLNAGIDQARTTRLIALDPAMFTLDNGTERSTLAAVAAILGLGPNKAAVEWASSAVFAVGALRQRPHARRIAAEYLAYERVLDGPEVAADEDMLNEATARRDEISSRLDEAVRRVFQHVLFLAQPDPTVDRDTGRLNLEDSALDGDAVWDALADAQKVVRRGAFTDTALLYNLRDSDYQRPLSEVRDAFWNSPRLPLLPGGVDDLRHAIYNAVGKGTVRVVRSGDEEVVVTSPNEINFNAPSYRLAKPLPEPEIPVDSTSVSSSGVVTGVGHSTSGANRATGAVVAKVGQGGEPTVVEQRLGFTIMRNLISEPDAAANMASLFGRLYDVLDRGLVSYISATLHVHLPAEQATEVAELAKTLGVSVTIRDQ